MNAFQTFNTHYIAQINQVLDAILKEHACGPAQTLYEAMSYSLLAGGKRVRPLLSYAAAEAVADPNPFTDKVAAAVECIHAYSLIHDDLPAMDDDDLRRGRATCHIAFDEATAILAGDALQALAFECLSTATQEIPAASQLALCDMLAKASGARGMVAGQAVDLSAVDQTLSLEQLQEMHRLKTGALIKASILMGALSTNQASREQMDNLSTFADCMGLAFQIQDDILDVTADTTTLGKQQGADIANNKPTFVSLLGLEEAQRQTKDLYEQALNSLSGFDYRADNLRHLAAYIVQRKK